MKFFRSQSPPAPSLSRADALACRPVILPVVHWQTQQSGDILIEYPLVLKPFLRAIFARFQKEQQTQTRKLQLDGPGSKVWGYIDGERTVSDIIRLFAKDSTLTLQEAEASVTMFLRQLGKRGLIVFR